MKQTPYLYLLVRKDLNSLNAGKAVAHGAHAASQFVYKMMADTPDTEDDSHLYEQFDEWVTSADGFGTKITLHVSKRELQMAVAMAKSMGFVAGETVDPTYPYVLDREYADLIDHRSKVSGETLASGLIDPNNAPKSVFNGGGKMLCLREELTAGYVFGLKDEVKPAVGSFPLMP